MKVLNYFYSSNEKKPVFGNANALTEYYKEGWHKVADYGDEGFCIINKPAKVIFEIIDDDGNYKTVDAKKTILTAYDKKKITEQMVKRFYDEVQSGKWRLALEKDGDLICFPS